MPAGSDETANAGTAHHVLNPFVARQDALNSIYDIVKVALMTVLVLPLRILGLCLLVLYAWVFAWVALCGMSEEERKQPLRGWRSTMRGLQAFNGRLAFYLTGWVVRVRGSLSREAPILVSAPHSTFGDAIVMFCCGLPSIITRSETVKLPFFGKLTDYSQPVYVSRHDPDSRQHTISEIKRRANSNGAWPQLLLFPEGTCTNRSCLIQFKPGAFYPGAPVQPVIVRYPNRTDTITWTWQGPSALQALWLTMTQLVNFCEVEFLPVYVPNDEEKRDPHLFANNVRAKMAEALDVPVSDYTYDDCVLMSKASSKNLPYETGLVEVSKLKRQLNINMATVEAELDKFADIARKSDGLIRLSDFAAYLGLPTSEPGLVELFNLYDKNQDGVIDFREHLMGVSLVSRPAVTEETLALAFRLFDTGGNGYVTRQDVTEALATSLSMTEQDCGRLFDQVEKQNENYITFEEFKTHAQRKPEYARIFMTWNSRQRASDEIKPEEKPKEKPEGFFKGKKKGK